MTRSTTSPHPLHRKLLSALVGCLLMGTASFAAASDYDALLAAGQGGAGAYSDNGWWAGALSLDLADFNETLQANGFAPLSSPMLLFGSSNGGRFGHWSLGGWTAGATLDSRRADHQAKLSVAMGAMDLAGRWSIGRLGLSTGALIGGGGGTLLLTSGEPVDIGDAVANSYDTLLTTGFFLFGPTLGASLDLTPTLELGLRAGYLMSLGDHWSHGDTQISGGPDIGGLLITLGISYGAPQHPALPDTRTQL